MPYLRPLTALCDSRLVYSNPLCAEGDAVVSSIGSILWTYWQDMDWSVSVRLSDGQSAKISCSRDVFLIWMVAIRDLPF